MPTIRQYFHKSVKNVLLIVSTISALILIVYFIGWVAPFKIMNDLLFYSLYFTKEIGIIIAIFVFFFWVKKARGVYKAEISFSQEFIKMSPVIIFFMVLLGSSAVYIDKSRDDIDCQKYNYNDRLNGGVKEFNKTKYIVNICGSGVNSSHFFGNSLDQAQITVIDEQGALLAKRRYKVFWDGQPGHEPITIDKDKIIFQDDENQEDRTITMPPTFLDWIRARLPFSG